MLDRPYQTLTNTSSYSKREFFKQHFHVHHPLLQHMVQIKLSKCLKYGQIRQNNHHHHIKSLKRQRVHVIQAPCIMGNQKTIGIRSQLSRKSLHHTGTKEEVRPKTTNTVIRSRTSQPRIRQKLIQLEKDEEGLEESLRPTLHIRRYIENNLQE